MREPPSVENSRRKSSGNGANGNGAPGATTDNISGVIRTVLAAQLVARNNLPGDGQSESGK